MSSTRRTFLKQSVAAIGAMTITGTGCAEAEESEGKPMLVNHVGFSTHSPKIFLVNDFTGEVEAIDDATGGVVLRMSAKSEGGKDLGTYRIGDFSTLTQPGRYRLRAGDANSGPFDIADDIYTPAINKSISYFKTQRCGDPRNGYHPGCHLDDGVRIDNGQRLDVTGGWHDACDLRKWVVATIWGMIGLSRVLDIVGEPGVNRAEIFDEMRWGNRYFRKMQAVEGYVMDYCGGDDGNNFTDNQINTPDDRKIHVEPCEVTAQFLFITAQASLARHLQAEDPDYAKGCLKSADRCMKWVTEHRRPGAAKSLGAWMLALIELHRAMPDQTTAKQVATVAKALLALQVTQGEVRGFFRRAADDQEPMREIMHGNLPMIALAEAIETWPDHPDATAWREALRLHVDHLLTMSQQSAFGIIPLGLYSKDAGSGRKIGPHPYRYFMKPVGEKGDNDDWWVGINGHLASHGVGLFNAARVLDDKRLSALAQRQLDWILGVNPFNASTITGVGNNQPPVYVPGAFTPPTPAIPGGVMNGIGGTVTDIPDLKPKSYHTCEYWTPMVAHAMWLMAEAQRAEL